MPWQASLPQTGPIKLNGPPALLACFPHPLTSGFKLAWSLVEEERIRQFWFGFWTGLGGTWSDPPPPPSLACSNM